MSAGSGIGISHDVVTLTLGSATVLVAESYEIDMSILTQPAQFSLRLGSGDAAASILGACPPGTAFTLSIDGATQMTGRVDELSTTASGGGSHEIQVRGRDQLAPLHDGYVGAAQSFTNITYLDLLIAALGRVEPGAKYAILSDDTANRQAITQASNAAPSAPEPDEEAPVQEGFHNLNAKKQPIGFTSGFSSALADVANQTIGTVADALGASADNISQTSAPAGSQQTIRAKIGQRWYDGVLKPEFDRVGLCLWPTGDGTGFVLKRPDANQAPIYSIRNTRGENPRVDIVGYSYKNDTTGRPSACDVRTSTAAATVSRRADADGGTPKTRR